MHVKRGSAGVSALPASFAYAAAATPPSPRALCGHSSDQGGSASQAMGRRLKAIVKIPAAANTCAPALPLAPVAHVDVFGGEGSAYYQLMLLAFFIP